MSHRSRASSRRTAPTEHCFYGSTQSIASGNTHAPSVYVPTEDRVGFWVSQFCPIPSSQVSNVPSHHLALSHQSTMAGQPVIQATLSVCAPSQTWESQGLGYAQSNRAPVYHTQVSDRSCDPSQYFLDVKGNYINIATCPKSVLRQLKKEKLEAERAAEHQTLRLAAATKQSAGGYTGRITTASASTPKIKKESRNGSVKNWSEVSSGIYVERTAPGRYPVPREGETFGEFARRFDEPEAHGHAASSTTSSSYRCR